MYLRHVDRDGCVDVDLATYYIGLQMAGRTVLLQVEAQSRQFAVWHQDQVVKLLPVPRLARPGDGPGRLSAVHPSLRRWLLRDVLLPGGEDKVRQPPLWGEGA